MFETRARWPCLREGTASVIARSQVRHRRLLVIADQQPLRPTAAPLAREPPPDALELHVPSAPARQLVVQRYAAIARLTERTERERLVLSQRAEDNAARSFTALPVAARAAAARPPRTAPGSQVARRRAAASRRSRPAGGLVRQRRKLRGSQLGLWLTSVAMNHNYVVCVVGIVGSARVRDPM